MKISENGLVSVKICRLY